MKTRSYHRRKGFTLVELIIVIAIMAIMLALAGNMLRDPGGALGMDAALQTLKDKIEEAKIEAKAKSTWTRVVIASDPSDTSANTRNLRFLAVMVKEPERIVNVGRESRTVGGTWKMSSRGTYLPQGYFLSPTYSTLLKLRDNQDDAHLLSTSPLIDLRDKARLSAKGDSDVFYIEFDPQGRLTEPSLPTRLVIIRGMVDPAGSGDDEGIRPVSMGKDGYPSEMEGIVVLPKGQVSRIQTRDQFFK